MLVFGHAGLTLGAALVLNAPFPQQHPVGAPTRKGQQGSGASAGLPAAGNPRFVNGARWLISLARRIDIRLLLVGSVLPDLVDKPVGQFFFRSTFSNGRLFGHSLLFLLVIGLLGLYLYGKHRRTWLLVLSFGTLTHLIFDHMWQTPRTLLWPLLGFAFDKVDLSHWMQDLFFALHADPGAYVPEIMGAAILAWFGIMLLRRRQLLSFVKKGNLG